MPRRDIGVSFPAGLAIATIVLATGAASAAGGRPEPVPRYVAKAPPPGRLAAASASAQTFGCRYSYVSVYQSFQGGTVVGAGGFFTQEEPAVAAADSHSLAELAVSSEDGQNIVEIGWTVDPVVNGDQVPHLFVYHWVRGTPTCYNGCGFVQRSATRYPGMRVEVTGTPQELAIRREVDGNWWLSYQGEAIGYFPGGLWSGALTSVGTVQWFGEVCSAAESTCSEMGNGKRGRDPGAAAMRSLYVVERGIATAAMIALDTVTDEAQYDAGDLTSDGFSYGGPGRASATCCRPSTCESLHAQCGSKPEPTCGGQTACGECSLGVTCTADLQCPGQAIADAGSGSPRPDTPSPGGGCGIAGEPGPPGVAVVLGWLGWRRRRKAAPRPVT
jgi:hypothetical protein